MAERITLAVAGAGLIGRRHVEHIKASRDATLACIIDPAPAALDLAKACGVPWFKDIASIDTASRPDGIILATPNQLHVEHGLATIAAGIPTLVEKPIADDVAAATRLVDAAEQAGVPLLVGHHRRHNPMVRRAKAIMDSGRLGRLVTVHAFFWLMKPDDYFDTPWRRQIGAGPVFMNLIHDVDLLRHLCGEISAVQAVFSNAVRANPIEETAVVLVRFADGALGTANVSDTVVAPWNWEQTTGENPAYPPTDQTCYFIAGTHASLTLPRLEIWSNPGKRSWWEPFDVTRTVAADADPLTLQITQFARVIRGEEPPLVSGREGLATLKVIEAIRQSAKTGQEVAVT